MKRIISDCFNLGTERLYDGEPIFQSVAEPDGYVQLDNGVWLQDAGDGRYYEDGTDHRYAAVYDWDEETDSGSLVGYVEL